MKPKTLLQIKIDEQGKLELPASLIRQFGLEPGASLSIEATEESLTVRRPVTQLAKLYLEPTNCCNLDCRTCIRHVWDEPLGQMSAETFQLILAGLKEIDPPPLVFFGGLGEPLLHKELPDMVAAVKKLGCRAEMITNGMLLTETVSRNLISAGLDMIWVSLDGASPESYSDVRLGAALPLVLDNLTRFRDLRSPAHLAVPLIGIAFVAMRRNVADLPELLHLGRRLGATHFMISNVLPYTRELKDEILYSCAMNHIAYLPSIWTPHVYLPKRDVNEQTEASLVAMLRSQNSLRFAGSYLGSLNDRCPFIEAGACAFTWEGGMSPCLPLLHSASSFLNDRPRFSKRYVLGNIADKSLMELFRLPEHIAFRERVQRFTFAPCSFCGGCQLSLDNSDDCYSNTFPTCGGCLWAQGIIQCP
jgi:MoaA/NifB/PqqE/SkfB family radical SAM enzyme